MSSKIGLIFSTVFMIFALAFGLDLISIQFIFTDLDAQATAISYYISKGATIDDDFNKRINEKYNVSFQCLEYCNPLFGDEVIFTISREYKPLIIKNEPMTISIRRSAIVGYYQ